MSRTQDTRNSMSLTIHTDDMIRHTQSLLSSFCFEDELSGFLLSQHKVMTSLKTEIQRLEASRKALLQENADLVKSNRLMKRQLDSVRASLVEEVEARKALKKERDAYQSRFANFLSLVQEETSLPAESPVRQMISRQASLVSQTRSQALNGLDTTDDSLTDLDYDKSEDDLTMPVADSVSLTMETPDASPSAGVITHRADDSCFMSISLMNQTMIEVPVTGNTGTERSTGDSGRKECEESALPDKRDKESTSTLASVTSVNSKCSVPDDSLMTSVECRGHDFVAKKQYGMTTCSGCQARIYFYSSSVVKCSTCSAVAHSVCQSRVPVPCLPALTGSRRRQSNVQHVSIADFCPSVRRPRVPPLLVLCFKEIERRASTSSDLLYVREEDLSLGERVKSLILSSKCAPDLTGYPVHVLCAAVKSFLRSLSEPLITRVLWQDFADASLLRAKQDRELAFYTPIGQLPEANRHSLSYLCKHLHTISHSPRLRVTPETLSNVFGSLVVGNSGKTLTPQQIRAEKTTQNNIMLRLLTDIPVSFWTHALIRETQRTPSSSSSSRRLSGSNSRSSIRRRSSAIRGGTVCVGMMDPVKEVSHS